MLRIHHAKKSGGHQTTKRPESKKRNQEDQWPEDKEVARQLMQRLNRFSHLLHHTGQKRSMASKPRLVSTNFVSPTSCWVDASGICIRGARDRCKAKLAQVGDKFFGTAASAVRVGGGLLALGKQYPRAGKEHGWCRHPCGDWENDDSVKEENPNSCPGLMRYVEFW